MNSSLLEGVVVQKSSRNVRVSTPEGVLLCEVRGKFRQASGGGAAPKRLPIVVGDRVRVRRTAEGEAVLEERLPRRSEIRRSRGGVGREFTAHAGPPRKVGRDREKEIVVAANVDQVLAVMAVGSPPPRWALLDRILISSEWEEVEAGICLNKWDQLAADEDQAEDVEEAAGIYGALGYPVFRVSALERWNLDEVAAWLAGKVTVLSGHSGVGKSTLLEALCPGVEVETGEVSRATGRGRHVTTASTLHSLAGGGFLVDTPGFREYGLVEITAPQLGLFYREFEPHRSRCRYTDCLHDEEPECAVLEAVEAGRISPLRYDNYLSVLSTLRGR